MTQGDLFAQTELKRPRVPYQRSSHSSWTGAQQQTLDVWTKKQTDLLTLLGAGQPLTRNQLAFFLLWPLSSVCSVLDSVRSQIEFVGYESHDWGDGKITKRERFKIRKR